MLNKSSVFMMVLLVVAASLIGISSVYQYVKGQGPPAATPQPQQQPLPFTPEAQVEVCDNFVDDDGDGFIDFDDPESCVPVGAPEGNMTVQPLPPSENVTAIDNFTALEEQQQEQPSPPTEPLVDEFGNIIPTEPPPSENVTAIDNFTALEEQQQVQKVKHVRGSVASVTVYASSDGKACLAEVRLPSDTPNNLGIRPGGTIELLAPDESICVLFGQSKIGKTILTFDVERLTTFDALPPTIREEIPPDYQLLYRVHRARM